MHEKVQPQEHYHRRRAQNRRGRAMKTYIFFQPMMASFVINKPLHLRILSAPINDGELRDQ